MKKYILLLSFLGFVMARCGKDPDLPDTSASITISGKVLQFGTLKPVVNAKVILINETGTGGLSGTTSTTVVDSTRTDAAGFYKINKSGIEKSGSYTVTASAEKYFSYDPTKYYPVNRSFAGEDIILDPYAWIKIHVKNQNPFDSNDMILLGNTITDFVGRYEGKNVELNYINRCPGNTKLFAGWSVWRKGAWTNFNDTIVVPAHDTLYYQILY